MSAETECWKVVRSLVRPWTIDGKTITVYVSCSPPVDTLMLEYRVGETTYPDVGRLFVFPKREDAERVIRHEFNALCTRPNGVLLRGVAGGVAAPPRDRIVNWGFTSVADVERFWRGETVGLWSERTEPWPTGTAVADYFRPIAVENAAV